MIKRMNRELLAVSGLLISLTSASASAQTFERDVTVTGPRGRTLERKTEIHRGPGGVERDIQIRRPSGTYSRQVEMRRVPGFVPRGRVYGPRFVPFGPPPPRPGFGPGALVGLGVGLAALPAIGFAAGMASRPPVVVAPAPIVAGPTVVTAPPVVQVAPINPADPVNLSAQKLSSYYYGSRRDGAIELGRLGDPRGVPALIHVLKYDNFKEVRIAAAHALGEIGGPQAATALERCIVYEKREPVRDAASASLALLRTREASVIESHSSNVSPPRARPPIHSRNSGGQSEPGWIPSPSSRSPKVVESIPTLEGPSSAEVESIAEDQATPPPPTPADP
jgi:hypothetical protein